MDTRRPSLITPHEYQDKEIKNYIYFIFSSKRYYSIQLSYTNNLLGIETNIDRAKQLSIDIANSEYLNNLVETHNVIVRCKTGPFKSSLVYSDNNQLDIIGGYIVDKNGKRWVDPINIKFNSNHKTNNCIIL